jgi:hypothetical protein
MAGERVNRKLAAILAADVVGYSRLMAADEAGTLAALKRHREGVFDPAVAAHNGRVVKLIGHGTIVEFASVVDAVNCALSVQRSGAPAPSSLAARLQPVTTGSIKTRSVKASQVSGLSMRRTLAPSCPAIPNSATRGPTRPRLRKADAAPGPPLKTKVSGRRWSFVFAT